MRVINTLLLYGTEKVISGQFISHSARSPDGQGKEEDLAQT